MITYQDISEKTPLTHHTWPLSGVVIIKDFFPHDLLDRYINEREVMLQGTNRYLPGWKHATPYQDCESMLQLATYKPLIEEIKSLIEEDPGLHLCLTGFQSTERAWHCDSYLNPELVGDNYIAAWIALDDIHPDSGPFEYVPGSQLWPVIQRTKVLKQQVQLTGKIDNETWPSDSQHWVGDACQSEIDRLTLPIQSYIPSKGDLLLWHAFTLHRGSVPKDPTLERRALICHYSSINHRPDMPKVKMYSNERTNSHGHYFDFT